MSEKITFDFQISLTKSKDSLIAERREEEATKLRTNYPNRIPVVIQKYMKDQHLGQLDQNKQVSIVIRFLIPDDFSLQQFYVVIRKRLNLSKHDALYIFFVNNDKTKSFKASMPLQELYTRYKQQDGFLYAVYSAEDFAG